MPLVLPTIHLMLSPATLTSQGSDRTELVRYSPLRSGNERLTGEQLIEALPELGQFAHVRVDPKNPHENATLQDILKLARHASRILADRHVDGLVLVHGTNGLEETAYFLHLTLKTDKPVIVTGAQRPFTALSSDGPMNLIDAFRVAACDKVRGLGVLVVANNQIHTARDVSKTSTYRLHTFQSRTHGPLGDLDADGLHLYRAPVRQHTMQSAFNIGAIDALPRVDILYVHAGARPDLVAAVLERGAKGIVVAGVGGGATGALRQELAAAAKAGAAVVVRSSRVGEGRVIRDDNWQEPGMIAADNLSPHKAAILLAIAMTTTRDPDEIQQLFVMH
ncbi:MAG TPA: asparaginase [Pseudolabrys sp.]|nr:asparaginase [Pseudolabrys sp.]